MPRDFTSDFQEWAANEVLSRPVDSEPAEEQVATIIQALRSCL